MGNYTTLPSERSRAIRWARDFLRKLLNPRETPRVPKDIRMEARSVLKHYPGNYDMQNLYKLDKHTWGKLPPDDEL